VSGSTATTLPLETVSSLAMCALCCGLAAGGRCWFTFPAAWWSKLLPLLSENVAAGDCVAGRLLVRAVGDVGAWTAVEEVFPCVTSMVVLKEASTEPCSCRHRQGGQRRVTLAAAERLLCASHEGPPAAEVAW